MARNIFVGVVLLVVLILVGGWFFLRRGFPDHEGELTLAGLKAPVQIHRDAHGIPHITAENEADAYVALGYAMAQDRLFQMEFLRAAGNGALSEILGEDLLETDKFLRKIMLRPRAPDAVVATFPVPVQTALRSFVNGVNEFLAQGSALPLEFTLLGHKPLPWNLGDVLAIGKLQSWDLSYNYSIELIYRQIMDKIGPEATADLLPYYGKEHFKLLSAQAGEPVDYSNLLAQADWIQEFVGGNGGSNNWVISGKFTASGKPILASDPHLGGSRMPGPWYFAHVQAPGLNVAGGCFPGAPLVLIGHNEHIAWGITNMGPDVQDLYIEEVNSQDPSQYLYKDQWLQFEYIPQEIRIKDKESEDGFRNETMLVKRTVHGPVIKEDGQVLALSWTGNLFDSDLVAFYGLNHARDWQDFTSALEHFNTAPQNFVYADVEGNIGYYGAGKIPVRANGNGRMPVVGSTGESDWVSMIPFEDLPHMYNPSEGIIVTANAEPAGPDYPYEMPGIYAPDFRTRRIRELLKKQIPAMVMEQELIQLDQKSLLAPGFVEYLLPVIPESLSRYRDALANWDYVMEAESGVGALYHETLHRFLISIWEDELGPELASKYLDTWYISTNRWVSMLGDPGAAWYDDTRTPQRETRDDLLLSAFSSARDTLTMIFGSADLSQWSWGKLHTIEFHHTFEGQGGLIRKYFNYGPFPFGGDGETVNRATYDFNDRYATMMTASMRFLIDMDKPHQARIANASGQVGVTQHPHNTDLIDKWLAGTYVDLSTDLDALPGPVSTLILTP